MWCDVHLLCASKSRWVPAASTEGFFCDRYAVRSRGSCLCSERSLIKWVILAVSLLLVLKMLYICVPALLYPTLSLIARTRNSNVTSHQENALSCTLRFAKGTLCSHQEGAPLLYGSTRCLYNYLRPRYSRTYLELLQRGKVHE